jgi:hypothetical protein
MLRARERAPILFPFPVFTFILVVESIKEFGGALLKIIFTFHHTLIYIFFRVQKTLIFLSWVEIFHLMLANPWS